MGWSSGMTANVVTSWNLFSFACLASIAFLYKKRQTLRFHKLESEIAQRKKNAG
jgi:hypothetical protein